MLAQKKVMKSTEISTKTSSTINHSLSDSTSKITWFPISLKVYMTSVNQSQKIQWML